MADKIEALIRSLPKAMRRNLGPAPDVARRIAGEIPFASAPLLPLVAAALSKIAGERIPPEMFDLERLPPHLRMKVRVLDDGGRTVVESRDLAAIREHLGDDSAPTAAYASSPWHRDGVTKWDFGALPEHVDLRVGGLALTKYPAVVDAGQTVNLRLCDTVAEAQRLTRMGVLRLFALAEHRELKAQVKHLPQIERIRLFAAPLCKTQPIDDQLIDLLASRAFYQSDEVPCDSDSFEAQMLFGRRLIIPSVQEITKVVLPLFEAYHEVRLALEQPRPSAWQPALDDIRDQLAALLPPGFMVATPWPRLLHLPRYLRAICQRLSKLAGGGLERDRQQLSQIKPRQEALEGHISADQWADIFDPQWAQYRWMLEELRVSLFAQGLGTSEPVSLQRLDRLRPGKF